MTHESEVDALRGRQLALIQLLPTEDALQVLASTPVNSDEEHAIIADLLTRHKLTEHIQQVLQEKDNG